MVSIFATPSWPLSCTAFQLLKGFFLPRAPRHDPTLQDTLTFPNDAQAALIILKTVLLRRLPITASSVNNLVRAHRGLPSRTFYLQTPKESAPKGRWQLVIPHESPLSHCLPALLPAPPHHQHTETHASSLNSFSFTHQSEISQKKENPGRTG